MHQGGEVLEPEGLNGRVAAPQRRPLRHRLVRAGLAGLAALGLLGPAWGDAVYKCRQTDGATVFSDRPCPGADAPLAKGAEDKAARRVVTDEDRARAAEERRLQEEARARRERDVEQCAELRESLRLRRQRESQLTPGERGDLQRLAATYEQRCRRL
ncbi:hypothetical protein DBR42_11280 [Pelomonas sp. HMWF004]|nr:hypothetical protein DBR42_11280 [Pelomonas sp. HMWF004]